MHDRNWLNQIALMILAEISSSTGHKFGSVESEAAVSRIASILTIAINEAELKIRRETELTRAALLSAVVEAAGGEVLIGDQTLRAPLPCKCFKRTGGAMAFRTIKRSAMSRIPPERKAN